VDATTVDLFHTFRRYPTQDALDLVASTTRKIEDMGGQVATAADQSAEAHARVQQNHEG